MAANARRDLMEVTEPDLPAEALVFVVCDMEFPDASVRVYVGPLPAMRRPARLSRVGGTDWMVCPAQDGGSGFLAYTHHRLVVSPDNGPSTPSRWGHILATPLMSDTYDIVAEDEDCVVVELK